MINEQVLKACGGKPENVEIVIETVNPAIGAAVSAGRTWVVQPVISVPPSAKSTVPVGVPLLDPDSATVAV